MAEIARLAVLDGQVEIVVDREPYGDEGSLFVHITPNASDLAPALHVVVDGEEVYA